MKLKISRISLMLVITILFTFFGFNIVGLADTLDYQTPLTQMHELGIIDSSVTNVNSFVTRGELLKSIIVAEGLTADAENSEGSTIFPDITANSELSGYINEGLNIGTAQGVNEGVVYGTPNGTYKPNETVTYAEACTIMVRLLGYSDTDSILQNAPWPKNYIQEASTLNLTTGISLSKFANLTVGVEAVLFDRLFDSLNKDGSFFSDNYYSDTTVTGNLTEAIILGNSQTSDNLADNQILTSIGTLTLDNGVTTPDVGGKYKLYVSGTTVTKVAVKENTLEDYAVKSISADKVISYTDDNNQIQTMSLPQASSYYYHGEYVDYDTAVNSIQNYSSIILAKNSSGIGYEYGIIVDPNFGEPYIFQYDNNALITKLANTKYDYMYRNGTNITEQDLCPYNVVYFVSDIWNKDTFAYVCGNTSYGEITGFTGNITNPTGLSISITTGHNTSIYTYTFSPYFNKTKLSNIGGVYGSNITKVGDYTNLVLGEDGSVVDII